MPKKPPAKNSVRGLVKRSGPIKKKVGHYAPHFVIQARAGSGKTTTLIQGLRGLKGFDPCLLPPNKDGEEVRITPSKQQEAIWEEVYKSRDARSITFVAFNRSIANELASKVPQGVRAKTVHGLGFGQIHKAWDLLPGNDAVNGWKSQLIVEEITGIDSKVLQRDNPLLLGGVSKLVGLCKANLLAATERNMVQLLNKYGIDLEDEQDNIFELVEEVLEICEDPSTHGFIDFNDQVWLPVIHDLPVFKSDLMLADEFQDMTPCQQALILKSSKRLGVCGDDRQAIYGWAGADYRGMETIYETLSETPRGCTNLVLNETRRCSKAVVRDAQEIVPDFYAHEDNSEGESNMGLRMKTYRSKVKYGDMIICRTNGPLVSECFKFIKMGKKANIQGRDMANGLIRLVKKLDSKEIPELIIKLEHWYDIEIKKEQAKKFPSDAKFIALSDKKECIMYFTEFQTTIKGVLDRIDEIFTEVNPDKMKEEGKTYDGILLTSGHKSKGLEAKNVFLLEPGGATMPHPMAKTEEAIKQEWDLRYVSITRAIFSINYVS